MTANPTRKTRFTVIAGCFLAALTGLTFSFVGTGPYRCRCNHERSAMHACLATMKQIVGAKEMWMTEYNKSTNDIPAWSDLVGPDAYLKDIPHCQSGAAYTIGKISEPPTCSIAEHNEYYKKCTELAKASTIDTNRSRLP